MQLRDSLPRVLLALACALVGVVKQASHVALSLTLTLTLSLTLTLCGRLSSRRATWLYPYP
jgi:hypothetical protein